MNPHLLPKIRSRAYLDGIRGMPCTLRIASFVPGHACAPEDTVVPCHLPVMGKGMATKTSDLFVVAGCRHCHDLLDGRDSRVHWINETHPAAFHARMVHALAETMTLQVMRGNLTVKGADCD